MIPARLPLLAVALAAPISLAHDQAPRVPDAIVDLRTDAGAAKVGARWAYADAAIVDATNRRAGADRAPTGDPVPTRTLSPTAADVLAGRAALADIGADSLETRRTPGRLAMGWYVLEFTVPESVGARRLEGATIVLEATVDDYAEVYADARQGPVLGSSAGPLVQGWNAPTRVVLTRHAQPGRTHRVAILASNGPLGEPPANYVWIRSATLDIYDASRAAIAAPVPTTIERLDPALDQIIPPGAVIEKLGDGFVFGEGPVWVPSRDEPAYYGGGGSGGYLLFSDPNQNVIHRFDPRAEAGRNVTVYRTKSGYAGPDIARYFQPGSNGLALDAQGRLTICEHGNRRVSRLEKNGTLTVLADRFEGKRLSSPNDLVYRSDGTLYFTDPPFGLPGTFADPAREIPFGGVYALRPDGTLTLGAKDLAAPNGLAFSPDERVLYVDNWETSRKVVLRYDVAPDGALSNPRTFFDMTSTPGEICLDGLKVDRRGNLFVSGPGGVWVLSPDATHLGTIVGPELPANFAFGDDDGRTLYMTARTGLYRLRLAESSGR